MSVEKKIIIDLDIKTEDIDAAKKSMDAAQQSSAAWAKSIDELVVEQKTLKATTDASTKGTEEYAKKQNDLKLKLTEARKGLRDSNKAYQQNKTVIDASNGSNDQLRARLGILTKKYNGLSKEQRQNSKEGQKMGATIKTLTDKLKDNEKSVGDNRRNVGNYKDSIIEAAQASGSFGSGLVGVASGMKKATIASLKFLATPIGAVIGAIGLAIGLVIGSFKLMTESLNRTEDGAAALTGVMNVFKGIMSGVLATVEPIALFLVEGLADGFEMLGNVVADVSEKIQSALTFLGFEDAANGLATLSENIKEASIATAELATAEAELNKITRQQGIIQLEYQNRAEKLRQIRDDEAKSIGERIQANKDLADVLTEQSGVELALAQRSLEIAELRIKADGESSENLDKKAEAELKIAEIQERITSQRSEQLTNENSLIRDGVALAKEANKLKIDNLKKEEELSEKAAAELIKRWKDERTMIDDLASLEKDKATISIENAEQRAEKIAYIEREALLEKIRNIDDETVAYTAAVDMMGEVDEVKYAKQLEERTKYEAQLAEIDRAARAQEFTDKVSALALDEQLENDAAELGIKNTKELEQEKAKIALKFLGIKLELMTKLAEADGVLTDKELKNLQLVENKIKKIKGVLANEDGGPTLADMIGLSEDDIADIQLGLTVVSGLLGSIQSAIAANANNRLTEIDNQSQAEIAAIEKSTASEEEKDKRIKAINKKAAQEKYKIELEQFKVSKALSIALAIANTATAVVAQLSNPTPYVGFVLAALAAVTGAIQIGVVSSTTPPPPPRFAKGGVLHGASHADGGIQLYGRGGNHYGEAEGDEIIMTKGVWRNPALRRKASELNVMGGGSPLTKGGTFMAAGGVTGGSYSATGNGGQSLTKGDIASAMAEAVANQPAPVVSVTEIENVSAQKSKVQVESDL